MDPVTPIVEAGPTWSFVDLALLIGLGLSVIVGAWRGLVHEVMSLLGWGAAYASAQWFGPVVAGHVPVGRPVVVSICCPACWWPSFWPGWCGPCCRGW